MPSQLFRALRCFAAAFLGLSVTACPATGARTTQQSTQDNTQPVGSNPIKIASVQRLGYQLANNSCSHRDLGFTGKLGGNWYAIFGDTLWCAQPVKDPDLDDQNFHGMVRDSVSLMTSDPLTCVDLHLNNDSPVQHQLQFVPFNAAWGETNIYGFGGTSLCEVDSSIGTGVIYYLVNAVPPGSSDSHLVGAGVGKVELVSGTPTVTKRYGTTGWWWNATTTPRYGDIAAYRDERSDYIYSWGGPPTVYTDFVNSSYIYQARVLAADAFDVSKYEYWWGRQQGWKTDVLTQFGPETAVLWGSGQGQVIWSPYYQTYVFVTVALGGTVEVRTAPAPEGPWTAPVDVYNATALPGGLVYAGVAHPYLDETGQTLVMSYTNNNHIEVIKATFTK